MADKESITLAEWSPLVEKPKMTRNTASRPNCPRSKRKRSSSRVENGVLVISGERKLKEEKSGKNARRRAYGSFVRSFSLPDDADADKVNAEFNDGVLKVHIAKSRISETDRSGSRNRERLPPSRPRHQGAGVSVVSDSGQCLNVLGKEDQNGKELLRNSRCEFECNLGGV